MFRVSILFPLLLIALPFNAWALGCPAGLKKGGELEDVSEHFLVCHAPVDGNAFPSFSRASKIAVFTPSGIPLWALEAEEATLLYRIEKDRLLVSYERSPACAEWIPYPERAVECKKGKCGWTEKTIGAEIPAKISSLYEAPGFRKNVSDKVKAALKTKDWKAFHSAAKDGNANLCELASLAINCDAQAGVVLTTFGEEALRLQKQAARENGENISELRRDLIAIRERSCALEK